MKIKDLFGQKKVTISCEIFPPKKDTAFSGIFETVDAIQSLGVDFISVTYGAGGSTSKKNGGGGFLHSGTPSSAGFGPPHLL